MASETGGRKGAWCTHPRNAPQLCIGKGIFEHPCPGRPGVQGRFSFARCGSSTMGKGEDGRACHEASTVTFRSLPVLQYLPGRPPFPPADPDQAAPRGKCRGAPALHRRPRSDAPTHWPDAVLPSTPTLADARWLCNAGSPDRRDLPRRNGLYPRIWTTHPAGVHPEGSVAVPRPGLHLSHHQRTQRGHRPQHASHWRDRIGRFPGTSL